MKATLHSDLPENETERLVAKLLQELNFNEEIDIWTVRLTGTKDTDVILATRSHGLFVLEIKGWQIDQIVKIKADSSVELKPSIKSKGEAWLQATKACDSFRARINKCVLSNYWWSPGVILFNISSADFEQALEVHGLDEALKRNLRSATIFSDEFENGSVFVKALQRVYGHPALREAPRGKPPHPTQPEIEELVGFYKTELLRRPVTFTAYDKKRLDNLLKTSAKEALEIPDDHSYCTGYAGTGKTIFSLQHAIQRRAKALFLCFNKVLATDIKRLIDLSPEILGSVGLSERLSILDPYDVHAWLKTIQARGGLYLIDDGDESKTREQKAKEIVTLICNKYKNKDLTDIVGDYQLIIIDEAQDLHDWVWELIEFVIQNTASHPRLFLIESKEQLLYRDSRSKDFDELLEMLDYTEIKRVRLFRTSNETFLVSQLFVESKGNLDTAAKLWTTRFGPQYSKVKQKQKRTGPELLDLPDMPRQGRAPKLWCVNELGGYIAGAPQKNEKQLTERLKSLICDTLKKLAHIEGRPSDLLLLVPFGNESRYRYSINWLNIARTACEEAEVQYIDYTVDKMRRVQFSPSEVRVSTFHSARGVEGLHVIVLGFEQLAEAAGRIDWKTPHLGYITLSRSVYDTDIAYHRTTANQEIALLEGITKITGFPTF